MGRKKKQNLEDLSQTHGKVESSDKYQTLDQIWGDDGLNKYKTLDINQYERELDDMDSADLKNHAVKIGLIPVDNRATLTKRLLTEFQKHVNLYATRSDIRAENQNIPTDIKKILSEGK